MALSYTLIIAVYLLFWRGRGGDWLVSIFQNVFHMDWNSAMSLYQQLFRNNMGLIWIGAIFLTFFVLFYFFLVRFTRYFNEISRGIDALLQEENNADLSLPPEMSAVEKKLNTVRQTLTRRALEAQLAEQRKNDLVMYLAHDIRTPLTSVIGYLSLLDEVPDMPPEQRAKYVHITLDKALRLEKLVNEFFEITRYNLQQIKLQKEEIDLSYMLVQLADEFYPIFAEKGNTIALHANENLSIEGDSIKLARVFNNILKNAATYSDPHSEISIFAEEKDNFVTITIQNHGPTIPKEKLSKIFEKFYRLDDARTSNTGGSGLGLAIAREIIVLHGGTISAQSKNQITTFSIVLPKNNHV